MVESINSCTLVASSSLMSWPLLGRLVYTDSPARYTAEGAVQHARFRLSRPASVVSPAVGMRLVLLALLLWPLAAGGQSASWEDLPGPAEGAADRGQVAEAERLYLGAVKQAESFGAADPRLAQSLTALGLFY